MRYHPLNPELYKANRSRFMRKMSADAIAIFNANDEMPRSGDTVFPFRQNSALFYLSGLDQEETVLLLFPDCTKDGFQEVAFIKRTNDYLTIMNGYKLTLEEARAISGIDKIFWLDEMGSVLHELILMAKRIYINIPEHDRFLTDVKNRDQRFLLDLQKHYPAHKYHRAAPLLKNLMMVKSPIEIEAIRYAAHITEQGFRRVLGFVRPGVAEYEIEAEITHEFIRRRANGHAFAPVIASGINTCILHYHRNTAVCRDGELLLLDIGAEYANYVADVSRTIPVNGRFSPRQRIIYDAVLRTLKAARAMLVPGTTLEDYHKEVGKIVESELLQMGLLDANDIKNQDPNFPAYKRFFMHGVSHHLGLDVHDTSDRYAPLQAGMVLTCEPGLYLFQESFGIRLENDILITDEGPVDLTQHIPIEAEEIETLMQEARSSADIETATLGQV